MNSFACICAYRAHNTRQAAAGAHAVHWCASAVCSCLFQMLTWLSCCTTFAPLQVQYKNVMFTVWDVGGQEKLRPLW